MPRLNPAPNTRHEFFTALAESEVLTVHQFAKADSVVPEAVERARTAAELLVAANLLTQFQADRLLTGRTDGFLLGQHVIQEPVGKGSVGCVYRATHRAMNRTVAIKMLSADGTRTVETRQAFQREVRAAARLNHPNIVTAYDANELGDRFYLVLEFIDGPSLEMLVRERGPLPWQEACELTRQVALGLQHAHEHGLVHRDIKPANLLATRASHAANGCVVKIGDFGIAKFSALPSAAPDYVSPEQAHNPQLADHRSDLYSLGCVLYYLLSGRPPFPGGSAADKLHYHQTENPAPIQSLRADVPPPLAELLSRLLAKDPSHRPQSAAPVAARLESLIALDARVDFNIPRMQPGTHSAASGFLTGPSAAETSPWAQLTDEFGESTTPTLESLQETPFSTPAYPRRKQHVRRGIPSIVILGLCAGVSAGCVLGLSLLLKMAGK